MKRKFLLFILTIAFCALCMGSFTSCLKHKHEHSFVLNSVTPATCRKPECRWYSCECGETSMEYVGEPLEHEWQEATCTEPQTCLVCGETRGGTTRHSWTDATCTEPQTCLVCGETRGGATGHSWANATCTEPQTCLVCGETSGEALGHNMAAPTCTKPATCKRGCGHTEGEPLGHTEVIDPAVESTCTEPGLTEGKHCSVCEEVLVTQKVVPALGHDWKNATCTMPKTCSVCNETEGNELGHDMAVATCTVASTCKRGCGYTVGEPLGHDMAVATCTLPSTCKRNCGYTEGEALGHTEVIDPAVASTCTEPGLTEGKHCSVCEEVLVTQKVVSALGHNFVNEVCSRCEKQLEYDDYLTFTYSGDRCSVRVKNINYVPEKVVIPDYVTSIEASGFKNCINMLSIEIPDSVISIGMGAFNGCSSLQSITIPFVGDRAGKTSSDTYQYPFGYIFGTSSYTGGTATKQYYYGSSTSSTTNTTYYIPTSLKQVTVTGGNILYGAFYNCSGLTSIEIPNSVSSIGGSAFNRCSSLTSIEIPNSVTSIGSSAFYRCSSLTEITLPFVGATVSAIGYQSVFGFIFGYTTDSRSSISGATYQYYDSSSTSSYKYYHYYIPSSLKKVTITGEFISYNAFKNCSSLTSVVIGDFVTFIGSSAFSGCSSLEFNVHGNGLYLGNENNPFIALIMGSNTAISTLEVHQDTKIIANNAFYNYASLTSVLIDDSVTSIGERAFSGCSSLTEVNYLGSIDDWAEIEFGSSTANPLYYAEQLKINGEVVTEVNLTSATKVSNYAFYYCSRLTLVVIGDSVTSIGSGAFEGCYLTSVVIGDSVTSIGENAFQNCSSETEVNYLGTIDEWAEMEFGNGYANPLYYAKQLKINGEIVTEVNLTSATKISAFSFYGCSALTSVVIGDSVTSIGSSAFSGCSSLTSVVIGDSVTSIGEYAFEDCSSLTEVNYLGTIDQWAEIEFGSVDANPLFYAKKLKINGEVVTEVNLTSATKVSNYAFFKCSNLTSVVIGDSVTSIGSSAFSGCSGLTSIEIPDSVTSIGYSAFSGCSSLQRITVPFVGEKADKTSSDTYQYPFGYIFGTSSYTGGTATKQYYYGSSTSSSVYSTYYIPTSLKKVTVTGGNILYGAFRGCSSLTSVVIGDSVTSIGSSAFYGCSRLTSVEIPESVTSIGEDAFYGCSSLTEVNYLGSIDDWAEIEFGSNMANPLCYAKQLKINGEVVTEVNLTSATKVSNYSFYNYDNLTSVIIGDSVTSIGGSAFAGCSGLTSVEIPDSVTYIRGAAFRGCSGLTSVVIGDSVTSIGNETFENCGKLNIIVIGNSVTTIGYNAFYGCNKSLKVINDSNKIMEEKDFSISALGYYALYVFNCYDNANLIIDDNGYIIYITNENTVNECKLLLSYIGTESELLIPSYITQINQYAFHNCRSLTSIEIPDSVTSIGNYAFEGCSSLTSVVIGDSVTSIGKRAFSGCSSLESMVIPFVGDKAGKTSRDIYQYPFGYIFGTSSYTGGTATEQCYYYDSSTTYSTYYIPTSLKEVIVTGGNILYGAFYNCSGLTSIEIPNSVTSIGERAFFNCSSLTSVEIPDSVASIGDLAFYGCSSLTSVVIPDSVTSIGSSAFSGCSSLTSVIIGDSVTSIGSSAFYGCSSLTSVVIPDSVTSIGSYAFYDCSSLTSVVIGDSVTSIGENAFYNCSNLTSVVIPDSVTSIGENAFYDCSNLTSVIIGDSVTSIGSYAFLNCYKLVEVINKSSYITAIKGDTSNGYIGYYALSVSNCDDSYVSKITNDNGYIIYTDGAEKILVGYNGTETALTLPSYVTEINKYAFYNFKSLTSVVIGDSVTTIGYKAFYSCSALTSVVIGNSVTTIGVSAFEDCSSLTSVVIGDSVTYIGYYAFYGCSRLTKVYYKGSNITVKSGNTSLTNATHYYYSESEPAESGNFWHYDENGNVVVW